MGTVARAASASASASTVPAMTSGSGWPDLPEGVLLLVLDRLPSVIDLLAVSAVCRPWRALAGPTLSASIGSGRPPLLLRPVLVPLGPSSGRCRWLHPRSCRLLSPADPAASYRCLIPPSILATPFLGYSHGHLIFCRSRRPLLADIVSGDVLRPPELPRDCRLEHGVLTAPLSAPGCNLLLYSFGSVLLQWRVGEREWSEHPLGAETVCMTRIMVLKGQIFTLDLRCRLFTLEFSPNFSVRKLAVQWPPESSDLSIFYPFIGGLVECSGELMLVRLVTAEEERFCLEVRVFRLDLSGPPSWVEVESLGKAALFVDVEHGSSASCSDPSRWGGRSNCVYLVRRGSDTWTALPLDGKAINQLDSKSPLYRGYNSLPKWPSPIWVYPSMLY